METSEDPHCMHCRAGYDHLFIMEKLNKSWFHGEYRERRKEILWEREQARLPETMELVEREIEIERLTKLANEARSQALDLKRRAKALEHEHRALLQAVEHLRTSKAVSGKRKTPFLLGCSWQDCRGYLNEDYNCKLCSRQTCMKCLSPRDDEHTCDEDAISTAIMIRKSTKPCPGCGEGIQKTDGCDQMWCLSCHTAFSWKTGAIERGVIHNPEYFRWQREHGGDLPRQPGDEPCDGGGRVNYRRFLDAVSHLAWRNVIGVEMQELACAYQLVQHITAVELVHCQNSSRACQDTTKTRVKYLKGDIDALTASTEVEKADRLRQRHDRAINGWQLMSVVGMDLLRNLAEELEEVPNSVSRVQNRSTVIRGLLETFFKEFGQLCDMANEPIVNSYRGSGSAPRYITRDNGQWRIVVGKYD